jgi:hypothetical protein
VFSTLSRGFGLASSPKGRRAIRYAIVIASSEEGRRAIARARELAASPESRKAVGRATKAAASAGISAGKAAGSPANRARVADAARRLRDRVG